MFKDLDTSVAYYTKQGHKNVLRNPKDETESFEKSGILEIFWNDRNERYYGQSRRAIRTCSSDYLSLTKYGWSEKSNVRYYILNSGHCLDTSS